MRKMRRIQGNWDEKMKRIQGMRKIKRIQGDWDEKDKRIQVDRDEKDEKDTRRLG
jgi:hypothetical protein